jgi:hypothetical protein
LAIAGPKYHYYSLIIEKILNNLYFIFAGRCPFDFGILSFSTAQFSFTGFLHAFQCSWHNFGCLFALFHPYQVYTMRHKCGFFQSQFRTSYSTYVRKIWNEGN